MKLANPLPASLWLGFFKRNLIKWGDHPYFMPAEPWVAIPSFGGHDDQSEVLDGLSTDFPSLLFFSSPSLSLSLSQLQFGRGSGGFGGLSSAPVARLWSPSASPPAMLSPLLLAPHSLLLPLPPLFLSFPPLLFLSLLLCRLALVQSDTNPYRFIPSLASTDLGTSSVHLG